MDNFKVDIAGWFFESWRIFKSGWQVYMLTALFFVIVNILAQVIPFGGIIVSGPLICGIFLVINDHLEGREYKLGRLFSGFAYFVPAFSSSLLIFLFTVMGLTLLIIPGLIIGSWYIFTYLFIIDRGMDFWPAMEASRKLAFNDIVGFALFFLVIGILNFLGLLFFFVGTLVTVPLTFIATYVAYRKLAGLHKLASDHVITNRTEST
ncbi:MAG: hypothetical protein ACE5EN_09695 [Nitrospinota bacterium]